jgi:Xaa-Pro aminopeptidase
MKLLLLSHDKNFFYFLGDTFDGSFLICDVSRKVSPKTLVVPKMEYERAKSKIKKIKILNYESKKDLRKILKKELGRKIFVNFNGMNINEFRFIKKISKIIDFSEKLNKIRAEKSFKEIKTIKKACKLTSSIEKNIRKILSVGKKEIEIEKEIERLAKEKGCDLSFHPIVASGKNSSFPHHIPGKRKLKNGDAVIVDFGIVYKNYCTDVTRTYLLNTSPEIKEIYNKVENARRGILEKIKDGTKTKDLQKLADKLLGKKMIHSIVHSIGLEVHEPAPKILRKNMIICIEPAIYTRKFGVRIENMILVKKNGCEVLV